MNLHLANMRNNHNESELRQNIYHSGVQLWTTTVKQKFKRAMYNDGELWDETEPGGGALQVVTA
jgi:hypothetical protein